MTRPRRLPLTHLERLTDDVGIVEHSQHDRPRRDLGYCTDDAARLLGLVSDLVSSDPASRRLALVALGFLERAVDGDGSMHLRLGPNGRFTGDPASDDAIGRAIQGVATAATCAPWQDVRDRSVSVFGSLARFRSPHVRASAHAALGAAMLVRDDRVGDAAQEMVLDAARSLPRSASDPAWPWPEARLSYSNALVPEAMLEVAAVVGDDQLERDALALLEWLVGVESRDGHFSFTPVAGRGPRDLSPGFDQQPIEAWSMASACATAWVRTGDDAWLLACEWARDWFTGANDTGVAVVDPATGAGFDGLEIDGVNYNRGAESTIAAVSASALVAPALRRRRSAAAQLAFSKESR